VITLPRLGTISRGVRTFAVTGFLTTLGIAFGQSTSHDSVVLAENTNRLLVATSSEKLFTFDQRQALVSALKSDDTKNIERILTSQSTLELTVNPEARVSIQRTKAGLPEIICGQTTPLLMRIVNQGGVTSRVMSRVTDATSSVRLEDAELGPRLAGASVEYRVLGVILAHQGQVDFTLRFNVGPGTEDLGNRATVSLLVNCSARIKSQHMVQ
jgi:hypothetical protein